MTKDKKKEYLVRYEKTNSSEPANVIGKSKNLKFVRIEYFETIDKRIKNIRISTHSFCIKRILYIDNNYIEKT